MTVSSGDGIRISLPPKQGRSRQNLEHILQAAESVVARDGSSEFTMLGVAEESGVSIGGIYRRFANREELMRAVKDRMCAEFEAEIDERMSQPFSDPASLVRAFVLVLKEVLVARGEGFRTLLFHGSQDQTLSTRGNQAVRFATNRFLTALGTVVQQGDEKRPEILMVAELLVGATVRRAAVGTETSFFDWDGFTDQLSAIAIDRIRALVTPS